MIIIYLDWGLLQTYLLAGNADLLFRFGFDVRTTTLVESEISDSPQNLRDLYADLKNRHTSDLTVDLAPFVHEGKGRGEASINDLYKIHQLAGDTVIVAGDDPAPSLKDVDGQPMERWNSAEVLNQLLARGHINEVTYAAERDALIKTGQPTNNSIETDSAHYHPDRSTFHDFHNNAELAVERGSGDLGQTESYRRTTSAAPPDWVSDAEAAGKTPANPGLTDTVTRNNAAIEHIISDPASFLPDGRLTPGAAAALEGLSRIGAVLAVAGSLFDIWHTLNDVIPHIEGGDFAYATRELTALTMRQTGTWGAALAGGEIGLELGAWGGPWGAVIGALIGGVVGGLWGFIYGDDFGHKLGDLLVVLGNELADNPFTHWIGDTFGFSFARHDPIVFDFGGHGAQLTALDGLHVQFDLDADGFAEHVGWISASSGLLVHDLNHNGLIDNGGELFGDAHTDGFAALAQYDDNHDGEIDASDTIYSELGIWQDLNQNGVTDAGELATLADRGIVSINLAVNPGSGDRAGNEVLYTGTFTSTGGVTGETLAVAFSTDQINTRYELPEGFSYDPDVFVLPNLRGYGSVPDLWIAMTLDPTLKAMVQDLVADASDFSSLDEVIGHMTTGASMEGWPPVYEYDMKAFDDILARWAGIDANEDARVQVEDVAEAFMNRDADHALNNPNFYHAFEKFATELGVRFYAQVAGFDPVAMLQSFAHAFDGAEPADGFAFTAQEISGLLEPLQNWIDGHASPNAALQPFGQLHYDFATDQISGDVDGLIDAQLSSYDFGAEFPWVGYDDWLAAHATLLGVIDPDGSRLAERHRIYTGNVDLPILHVAHAEVMGTSGADTLGGDGAGLASPDLITGGAGNDTLGGGAGDDTYLFKAGSGNDIVTDTSGTDEIAFQGALTGAIAHFAFANGNHQDLLISFEGRSETVTVIGYFAADGAATIESVTFPDGTVSQRAIRDAVYSTLATAADDSIMTSDYGTTLPGLAGNDVLIGRHGDDALAGGAGDDHLTGSGGNDTYVFGLGGGHDVVLDTDDVWNGVSGFDTIAFTAGIFATDISVTEINDGNDLVLSIDGTDDSITIVGTINDRWERIEQVVFADGTVWTHADLMARALEGTDAGDNFHGSYDGETIAGRLGDDTIDARGGDDLLIGGAGNDLLSGSGGDDVYQFGPGDGQDVIREYVNDWSGRGGFDTIRFDEGIDPTEVTVSEINDGEALLLTVGGVDTITIQGTLNDVYQRIEQVVFSDGTVWSHADLVAMAVAPTSGVDTFWGSYDGETIDGGAGNDVIDARGGNDVLAGGTGNDLLSGSGGDDTYRFGLGDGQDTIRDYVNDWSGRGGFDTIELAAGIAPADVSVHQADSGDDLVLSIAGTTDSITLDGAVNDGYQRIEQVVFNDGTVWSFADLMGIALAPTSGVDTFWGSYDGETIEGGAGNDVIDARGGNDVLVGGTGNDLLSGSGGDDTYRFGLGDGQDTIRDYVNDWSGRGGFDIISFGAGITATNLTISQADSGNDLLLSINGTSDQITIDDGLTNPYGYVEEVHFADGTVWSRDEILARSLGATPGPDTLYGDTGANTLDGIGGDDTIDGRQGNDILIGGTGNDTLIGSGGDDTYRFGPGDGQDIVRDSGDWWNGTGGNDTVAFGVGIAPSDILVSTGNSGGDLVLSIAGTTDKVTLVSTISDSAYRIEQVVFADGTIWSHADLMARALAPTSGNDSFWGGYDNDTISGGAGNDTIDGRQGNDILIGGTGNDTLIGSGGDDTYQFGLGDGQDIVRDYGDWWNGTGGNDKLEFLVGIAPSDIVVTEANTGSDLVLSVAGTTDRITLQSTVTDGAYRIEQVVFADGTIWSHADLMTRSLVPTSGNDTFWGGYDSDTIGGGAGDDTIDGRGGNDILTGGTGNDTMIGSGGDDTYRFGLGDGQDIVRDYGDWWNGTGGNDTLQFLTGIAPADIVVTEANGGSDLVLSIAGTTDTVTLAGTIGDSAYRIEQIVFAGGTIWSHADLMSRALTGTSGNDSLWGDYDANTISGAGGNDTIDGRQGNDILIGGTGNDTLIGSSGDDTYRFGLGDGQDTIRDYGDWWNGYGGNDKVELGTGILVSDVTVTEANSGNDLVLSIAGTSDTITLAGTVTDGSYRIEQIVFADATIWSHADLMTRALAGTTGNDTLWGSYDNDTIGGGAGNDTIDGRGGDDTIASGGGADTLTGGGGADIFAFSDGDSGLGAGADRITDFASGTDRIDLSAIDADAGTGGNQAFTFIGTSAFSNFAGELRFEQVGSDTWLQMDEDGDGLADMAIVLSGSVTPLAADFVL